MKQTAVEWLEEMIAKMEAYGGDLPPLMVHIKKAKEMEKQQQGYSDEELFKIIDDFCFDWNYNYKGELSQKEYLKEWFKKNINK